MGSAQSAAFTVRCDKLAVQAGKRWCGESNHLSLQVNTTPPNISGELRFVLTRQARRSRAETTNAERVDNQATCADRAQAAWCVHGEGPSAGRCADENQAMGGSTREALEIFQPVRASRDCVWLACSTPEGLSNWQADEVRGDVKVGSTLSFGWPTLGAALEVEVVEIVNRLAVGLRTGRTSLRVELAPGGVRLRINDYPTFDTAAYEASWRLALGELAFYAEHHASARRRVHRRTATARCSAETAYLAFSEAPLRSLWLDAGERAQGQGEAPRWSAARIASDQPGHGLVLAPQLPDAPLLVMRTLPGPDTAGTRTLMLAWSEWDATTDSRAVERDLDSAIKRLVRWLESGNPAIEGQRPRYP